MSAASPPNRITVCMIDGSTIAASVVERTADGVRVLGTRLIELMHLAEIVERLRHPVFLDVYAIRIIDSGAIRKAFDSIFADSLFRNPILGVFPAGRVLEARATSEGTPAERNRRRKETLTRSQNPNPESYPAVFAITESAGVKGDSTTSVDTVRQEDMLTLAAEFSATGQPFLGFVLGQAAAGALLRCVAPEWKERAVTMLNIGKNQTVYSTLAPNSRMIHNPIPVGLARDDLHYFTSLPPSVEGLVELRDRIGGALLMPPDTTPTPILQIRRSTPQIDCTRFAQQVAQFAARAIESVPAQLGWDGQEDGLNYLVGRASRVPGLVPYIQRYTETVFHPFEEEPLSGIELADGATWGQITDAPETVGAAIAFFEREENGYGMLLRESRMLRPVQGSVNVGELEDGTVYLIERAFDMIQ